MDFGALPPEVQLRAHVCGAGVGSDVGRRGGLGWEMTAS
jgi:hypothetical protein